VVAVLEVGGAEPLAAADRPRDRRLARHLVKPGLRPAGDQAVKRSAAGATNSRPSLRTLPTAAARGSLGFLVGTAVPLVFAVVSGRAGRTHPARPRDCTCPPGRRAESSVAAVKLESGASRECPAARPRRTRRRSSTRCPMTRAYLTAAAPRPANRGGGDFTERAVRGGHFA
jgi:hypothetical protein